MTRTAIDLISRVARFGMTRIAAIELRYLPSSADAQREQLVRRLAAEDDTIDLIGNGAVKG